MPPAKILPLVDRLVPGGAVKFLTVARANGDSYDTIADRLERDHGVAVTSQTIANWCRDLEITKPAAS